ncbi:MAG: hypothetical protein HEQ19_13990 [Gloeotrichia echinulata CP02]|jgi:hypothetical protein|nr:hypothetical protein [Gloeotrichia echinulata DEX184]
MPLPEAFSEWEHLQDHIRLWHNKAVQRWFKNQKENDITSPKAALRHACTIKDSDTATMLLIRLWLFEVTAGHAQSLQAPVYGVPVIEWQRDFRFKPQIKLCFKEPYAFEKHGNGTNQVTGETTFRLMSKTSETITRADAVNYARAIKSEFTSPLFIWRKGKYKCTYLDIEKGYDLRLLVQDRQDGIALTKAILNILNVPFEDDNFQFIQNSKTFPANPGTNRVYGRQVKKPQRRPTANCVFTHAQLLVYGMPKAINLVSVNGKLKSSIENIYT